VDVITADVAVAVAAAVLAEAVVAAVTPRGDGARGAALFFVRLELLGDAASIWGVKPQQLSD
jgi:hypothetical protein